MNPRSLTDKIILKRQVYASDQEVRWCPGCGDYAILATVQKTLPLLNIPKENIVFISGIGCSSRFPYYLDTFGFHTIHGRAPTIATGLKITRPELTVFVVTGDGDGLSIGSNHLLHLMRRNVNVVVLLFNNRIYGLTKGQYSPTSELGKQTKTSPLGTLEQNLEPLQFALGADCSFIARCLDIDSSGLQEILVAAVKHKGTSFIEILQNCNVFNDGAFKEISDKLSRAQQSIFIKPGSPMIFGQGRDHALILEEGLLKTNTIDEAVKPYVHTTDMPKNILCQLVAMKPPKFPLVTGILRQQERSVFEEELDKRFVTKPTPIVQNLLYQNSTWKVD
ncbi:MAG TPA: 2-oxoacid:ferredoxin oxidoreductase subunit beta [Gammaproteobacteria bacterium]|nr:2-oxoacid:ferredoxin oxidoreductase subunit beta [Gammaproteobacteria bacterium]